MQIFRYRTKHNSSSGGSSSHTQIHDNDVNTLPHDNDSSGEPIDGEFHDSSASLASSDGQDYNKMHQNDTHEFANGNSPLNMNHDSNSSIEVLPDPVPHVNSSPVTYQK